MKALEAIQQSSKQTRVFLSQICHHYGISRQSHYQWLQAEDSRLLEEDIILQYVHSVRHKLPKLGGRKLHHLLTSKFVEFGFSMGRDRLFDLLREHHLLIERVKRRMSTTNSKHRFYIYNNLLKGLDEITFNQALVADITYIETMRGFCYLALITEVYSRKVVGYDLSQSLGIEGSIRALKMAIATTNAPPGMIHHSDRGVQYCSKAYVRLLKERHMQISMAEKGNPYENAIAERMNGILKEEFLLDQVFPSFLHAKKAAKEAIHLYNTKRPHMSLDYQTPDEVYKKAA
jgi:putative transposase